MPYGRPATVRSHRRGGPRRQISLTPWLAILGVLVLLGGGITAGVYYVAGGCDGDAEATVVVTPRIESIMQALSQDWARTSPDVDGVCARVTIVAKDPAEVSNALSGEWDTKVDGTPPDAWVPDSSAWVRRASVDADAERIVPDLQPSLARSPTVIAMPKEMAVAAGMTAEPLTWQQIIDKLNPTQGWRAYNHAEWGPVKVALADPQTSTAGLLALMAVSDTDDDGEVSEEEQQTLLDLKRVIKLQVARTSEIFNGLASAAADDPKAGLAYVSAFFALEQEVLEYNLGRPRVPLVAIYPQNGSAEADFPYLVLNAPWAQRQRQDVAGAFMRFIRAAEGKAAFLEAGFRDSNRIPGADLRKDNGVVEKITALPRAILLPESVQRAAASWTALTRPTNLLLVFDTSGSMGGVVPGTGRTRLDLTKGAAIGALSLLDDEARVGVWAFSTVSTGNDHRKLLDLRALGSGGGAHRESVVSTISNLVPRGNTGLYNTVWAANQEVRSKFQPGATNLVVLLTDGADDNNIAGSMTLEELANNLRGANEDESKRVPVITVGLGRNTDSEVLREIATASTGATYSSPTSFDISQVLLTALFSPV